MLCPATELKLRLHSREKDDRHVIFPQVVQVEHTGKRGRPRKIIDERVLRAMMSPGQQMSQTVVAKLAGVHRNTVRKLLREYKVEYKHSDISDDDLDTHIHAFRLKKPNSGIRYAAAYLADHGLRVQRDRIIASLRHVDPIGQVLRHHTTTRRRQYRVARPNALWHMDGHHKLIRWGIVIHGIVDGYCRTVCYCSDIVSCSDLNILLLGCGNARANQQPLLHSLQRFPKGRETVRQDFTCTW